MNNDLVFFIYLSLYSMRKHINLGRSKCFVHFDMHTAPESLRTVIVQNQIVFRGRNMPIIDEADAADDEDEQAQPEEPENMEALPAGEEEGEVIPVNEDLFKAAIQQVRHENKATISLLQRRLNIGYNSAAKIMELLEERGIVGPPSGSGNKREILIFDDLDINN